MSKNKNYESRMIKDFLTWIEDKHFVIMENGSFKSNSMYFNQKPQSGETVKVNIRLEMRRPKREDLEDWIDIFLKRYDKESEDSVILG